MRCPPEVAGDYPKNLFVRGTHGRDGEIRGHIGLRLSVFGEILG